MVAIDKNNAQLVAVHYVGSADGSVVYGLPVFDYSNTLLIVAFDLPLIFPSTTSFSFTDSLCTGIRL